MMKVEIDKVNGVYYLYLGDGPTPTYIIEFKSIIELLNTLSNLADLFNSLVSDDE